MKLRIVPAIAGVLFLARCASGPSRGSSREATAAQPAVSADFLRKVEAGMVRIRPGWLPAGYRSERSFRTGKKDPAVRIAAFFLSRHEVTQEEWTAVMGDNPSEYRGEPALPVTNVSWNDAQAFIARLNQARGAALFRLPTAEEWEYGCRAGARGRIAYQDKERMLNRYAWWGKNSGGHAHPVGRLKPNAWGLYDMLGNVAEWCENRDEIGPGRVMRPTAGDNFADENLVGQDCRPGGEMGERGRDAYTGFRLAMSASGAGGR